MKNVMLLMSSLAVFIILTLNLYYNVVTYDVSQIEEYINKSNLILNDVINNKEEVLEAKEEYLSKLEDIKDGIEDSKTTFIIFNYKNYKLGMIDSIEKYILSGEDKSYLEDINRYNEMAQEELDKILARKFIKVTL